MAEATSSDQELNDLTVTISNIKPLLKKTKLILPSAKIRYLLDALEKEGIPENVSTLDWKFRMTRSEKWEMIRNIKFEDDQKRMTNQNPSIPGKTAHRLNVFLDCIKGCWHVQEGAKIPSEHLKCLIKVLFKLSDKKLTVFFKGVKEDNEKLIEASVTEVCQKKQTTITELDIKCAVSACLEQFEKQIFMVFDTKI